VAEHGAQLAGRSAGHSETAGSGESSQVCRNKRKSELRRKFDDQFVLVEQKIEGTSRELGAGDNGREVRWWTMDPWWCFVNRKRGMRAGVPVGLGGEAGSGDNGQHAESSAKWSAFGMIRREKREERSISRLEKESPSQKDGGEKSDHSIQYQW
jgi:hypothetical protein